MNKTDRTTPPTSKTTTEDPELADRFNRVLGETLFAMEESGLRYLFIGGIASHGLGRPRSTHDIDLFVMPEDAELALRALAKNGFRTEKTDPSWLYKGWKDDILVDVIFKSKGEIYLDNEMYQRNMTREYHGKKLRLVAPEDLLIIKAAAHSELTPGHWHDATAILSHANVDWHYLLKRAKRAPRRILSLLLYAQSNDIWVPNWVVHELYAGIFGDVTKAPSHTVHAAAQATPRSGAQSVGGGQQAPSQSFDVKSVSGNKGTHPTDLQIHRIYALAHLRQALAEDSRTNELDIQLEQAGNKILLRGEVSSDERKNAVGAVAQECFPDSVVENQIRVMTLDEPRESEEVK